MDTPVSPTPVQPTDVSLIDGLLSTRAIRRYTDERIPEATLRDILFAATRAPSGSNRQPFRFLVLDDPSSPHGSAARLLVGRAAHELWAAKELNDGYTRGAGTGADTPKARMARTMREFVDRFETVPVMILACLNRYREPHFSEGGSIFPACQNLLLAARGYGFGGVISGFHTAVELELRTLLHIPDDTVISATITLGRPAGSQGPVRRRPLAELVYGESWGDAPTWAIDPPGTRFTSAGPPTPALPIARP